MKKTKLRIAAVLVLLTGLAHTAGTFMPIPPEQTEVANAVQVMKSTLVPMPVGQKQSYADIFLGTNLIVSLFLLVSAFSFWSGALADYDSLSARRSLIMHAVSMLTFAVVSAMFFFPVPAIFTAIAGMLALWAAKR